MSALALLVAAVAAVPCDLDLNGRALYPFAEAHPELVAEPTWGPFFSSGYDVESRWASDEPLPTTRIPLALPPPWSGELVLRHHARKGRWWCSGELRVEEYEGAIDLVRLELPLEATYSIRKQGRVLERGSARIDGLVFSDDEIVLPGRSLRMDRMLVNAERWAATPVDAVEQRRIGIPNFQAMRELLARLRIGRRELVSAPAPWPRIGLLLLVSELVDGPEIPADRLRLDALAYLDAARALPPEHGLATDVARWTSRLRAHDDSLSTDTAEAQVSAGIIEVRVNGRTVFERRKSAPVVTTIRIPVPRSGLAFIETRQNVYYANGGLTVVHPGASWVPLSKGQAIRIAGEGSFGFDPVDSCVRVEWEGSGPAPTWRLTRGGRSTGPFAPGLAAPASAGSVTVSVGHDSTHDQRAIGPFVTPIPGTATFRIDASGAVTGAFETTDRCRP